MTTRSDLEARIADLKRKLKAREKMSGYAANVSEIRARLSEAEAQLEALSG